MKHAVCWRPWVSCVICLQPTTPHNTWYRWAGFKVTLSSVSEPGFQKPPHSTYSTAAGANPAAEPQAATKVGASSCTCSFGGLSFSLKASRRMAAEERQLRCQVTAVVVSYSSERHNLSTCKTTVQLVRPQPVLCMGLFLSSLFDFILLLAEFYGSPVSPFLQRSLWKVVHPCGLLTIPPN